MLPILSYKTYFISQFVKQKHEPVAGKRNYSPNIQCAE